MEYTDKELIQQEFANWIVIDGPPEDPRLYITVEAQTPQLLLESMYDVQRLYSWFYQTLMEDGIACVGVSYDWDVEVIEAIPFFMFQIKTMSSLGEWLKTVKFLESHRTYNHVDYRGWKLLDRNYGIGIND